MKNKNSNNIKKKNIFYIYIFILFIIIIILFFQFLFLKVKPINEEVLFKKLYNGEVDKILIKHHTFVYVWVKKKFYNQLCNNAYYLAKNKLHLFCLEDFIFEIGYLQFFIKKIFFYKKIYELDFILIFKKKEGYKIKKFFLYYLFFFCINFFLWSFYIKTYSKKSR